MQLVKKQDEIFRSSDFDGYYLVKLTEEELQTLIERSSETWYLDIYEGE
ncbi:MAG: hypothetical protein ACTSP3_08220 [Candidatus Heimdallarchaeaceae archaeon]